MNIAIFSDSFYPGVGGTERATFGLAEALAKKGHSVAVCCPSYYKKEPDNYIFSVFRAKSLKLTKNDFFAFPALSPKFKKLLKSFKPDVIHCQSVSPMTAYAIKYAKKHNIPVMGTVHTKFKTAFENSIKSKAIVNMLIKNLVSKLNKMDEVCVVCNDMVRELHEYGYKKDATVIRNGATFENNLNYNKELCFKEFNLKNEDNIFLYVGYIVKYKNLQFILDSLKIVKEKISNFKMVFVGGGLDLDYFKNIVNKSDLKDNIIFTGQITNKELLYSLYNSADLFLFPSIFDNDPLVVVEAASCHLPAVTLENTGASERILADISGYTTENNTKSYANKIIEILSDKEKLKEVGNNAFRMIPKTWAQTSEEYLNIYEKIRKSH